MFTSEAVVDRSSAPGKRVFGARFDQKLRAAAKPKLREAEDILISARFAVLLEHYLPTKSKSKKIQQQPKVQFSQIWLVYAFCLSYEVFSIDMEVFIHRTSSCMLMLTTVNDMDMMESLT